MYKKGVKLAVGYPRMMMNVVFVPMAIGINLL